MKIYCLINVGNSLTDEISQLLFDTAQKVMANKSRKSRLKLAAVKLSGEIVTSYEVGFMGSVAGIVFKASFDWDEGTAKTDFIVRPVNDPDEIKRVQWVRTPLFQTKSSDAILN